MLRCLMIAVFVVLGGAITSCSPESPERPALLDLSTPQDDVVLQITGKIAVTNGNRGALFDMTMLKKLPTVQIETHTSVTDGPQRFAGFRLRDLLRGLGADGETIKASALNDYVVEIPMADLEEFDVIVAHSLNGKPLAPHDKGPLWIVYPRDQHPALQDIRYDYRWVWQLNALDVE
ncbi:MAG: molybdopterin-dependent oxidoreductase [Sphingobium sp.]